MSISNMKKNWKQSFDTIANETLVAVFFLRTQNINFIQLIPTKFKHPNLSDFQEKWKFWIEWIN